MSISREEFNAAIGDLHKKVDAIATTVTRIDTTLTVTPIPRQPCEYLNEHVREHKQIRGWWIKATIGAVISWIVTTATGAFTALWFVNNKGQ